MKRILGLDIGGANLKVAHTDGTARTVPFELWKQPAKLPAALRELVGSAPAFDQVAVTTTDIIPLTDGKPIPQGRTDPERLQSGELVYRGARRTPILWCSGRRVAAEVFATVLDALLVLDKVPEDPSDRATADGRPATRKHAHGRLARMLGGDGETCPEAATLQLAHGAWANLSAEIAGAIAQVAGRLAAPPRTVI